MLRETTFWPERDASAQDSFLLSQLPPSKTHIRLAFSVLAILSVTFVALLPFKDVRLPRLDGFIPALATAIVINDLVTAALLLSHFAAARKRALLILASGYLFSALIIVPYALTFPGAFSSMGLLGGGLQTAPWLYWFWHAALPISVISYVLLKDAPGSAGVIDDSWGRAIGWSVGIVLALVGGLTWFTTAQESLLPIVMRDRVEVNLGFRLAYGGALILPAAAGLTLLWVRRRSVLDLWLIAVCGAFLFEITLGTLLVPARFSLAWYGSRIFSYAASTFVLIVGISELTALHARLVLSNMLLQRERANKLMSLEAMASSIAHEVRQPLGAIATNGEVARLCLTRIPPDPKTAQEALADIVADVRRAGQILKGITGVFGKTKLKKEPVNVNDVVLEVLSNERYALIENHVKASLDLTARIPLVLGNKGQLRQVVANLVHNAIEAMIATEDDRRIKIRTSVTNNDVIVELEDTGPGIEPSLADRIFEPFTTTKSSGMGLGLAICQTIVEHHNGRISASSKSAGTIIRVSLPTV
ncbi:MASE4 domain-containing protein [Ensifer sp. IC3342]|nr:MASE4 domain-containing protein [Ensifer sp. BRP08]MCA1448645.1 MASE4 domain-containing protein [Ensifer sp. IC3342]